MTLAEWLRKEAASASPRTIVVSLHRGSTDEIVGDPFTMVGQTAEWAAKKLSDRATEDRASESDPTLRRYVIRTEQHGFSIYV